VLKNYQDVTVEAYLNDESIEIERIKDTKNDKLVQIKLVFTMSAFTKCFRPVSSYPSDFSDLVVWLRADSGVTFDIPTKRVSAWADGSGNSNDVAQATKANQPLRNGYDGINDKAYISFDGTNHYFTSNSFSPITENFTIFEVSKINNSADPIIGFTKTGGAIGGELWMGLNLGKYYATVVDESGIALVTHTSVVTTGNNHIAILRKHNKKIDLEYYDSANSLSETDNNSGFNHNLTFNNDAFTVGNYKTLYLEGDISEVIVYNRALSSTEIADVKGYLNLKYKIY